MKKYKVIGMSCAACQARVEKAVSAVDGVESCAVSLLTNSMGVEGTAQDEEIIEAVVKAGYGASLFRESELADTETPALKKRLILSVIFLIILMYYSMGHMMLGWPVIFPILNNHMALAILEMILAIIIMFINRKFFTSGFRSLFSGAPNMDTLVALGSTASFGYSMVAMFKGMDLYFESAAMIPTLITVGKLLEALSKGRTTDALKTLMKMSPKTAHIETPDGEREVPVENIKIGDVFILKAGYTVPVDGVVIEGNSAVNEAMLSGESIPVDKETGSIVSAGTQNVNGFLRCRATHVGEDTTLAGIIKIMSDAAATKAPLARIADRVSAVFVPAVILISVLTFTGWMMAGRDASFSIARAISVLVISCPCALGLATPVAIMVGNGMGAKNGILYKTAESLETAGRVKAVVLDKTGTITKGEPGVTDVVPEEGVSEEELLSVAYSLEKMSEHPLAKAVVEYVDGLHNAEPDDTDTDIMPVKTIEITSFQTLPGAGVQGTDASTGDILKGGNSTFISIEEKYKTFALEGKTPLLFMRGERYLGMIAVADQIKSDSPQAIKELKDMGIFTVMLTGDNGVTANAVAEKAGVDKVIAGVMPDDKENMVAVLHSDYGKVAMVGDGINDAPALIRSDAGFAIGSGTDVAVDAADIVLMKDSLLDVAAAIRMSKATIRNIHQNLFWAFFYNALCIPLAMGLYGIAMKPMYGAAAMALSSFFVCMNALRLNRVKLYLSPEKMPVEDTESEEEGDDTMKKTMMVEGMMCEHCEATVQKALEAIDGVKSAKASHKKGTVVVKLDNEVSDDILKTAVEEKDYKVTEIK
ncbi:MAG: heavy metal translocating P-type ATPase [Eubacterium sp.]|nr:heavy metal translocating P-type ATPase [Eubacterium sp.]